MSTLHLAHQRADDNNTGARLCRRRSQGANNAPHVVTRVTPRSSAIVVANRAWLFLAHEPIRQWTGADAKTVERCPAHIPVRP